MKFIRITDPEFLPELLKRLDSPGEYSPEELKEIYAAYKEQFTAADLQKYAEPMEDCVFLEDLIQSLKEQRKTSPGSLHER